MSGATPPDVGSGRQCRGDSLRVDEEANPFISGADLALAVVDEIEEPTRHRTRFTVAY